MFEQTTPDQLILYVSLTINGFWMIVSFCFVVAIFRSAIDLIFHIHNQDDLIRAMRGTLSQSTSSNDD